jgi:hypothetical protein
VLSSPPELEELGSLAVSGPLLSSLDDSDDPSDAADPASPLTRGATTSDDDVDRPESSWTAALPLDATATVVVVVEDVLERCNAARTDEGDNAAGR